MCGKNWNNKMSKSTSIKIDGLDKCKEILLLQSSENEVLETAKPKLVLSMKDQPRMCCMQTIDYFE